MNENDNMDAPQTHDPEAVEEVGSAPAARNVRELEGKEEIDPLKADTQLPNTDPAETPEGEVRGDGEVAPVSTSETSPDASEATLGDSESDNGGSSDSSSNSGE